MVSTGGEGLPRDHKFVTHGLPSLNGAPGEKRKGFAAEMATKMPSGRPTKPHTGAAASQLMAGQVSKTPPCCVVNKDTSETSAGACELLFHVIDSNPKDLEYCRPPKFQSSLAPIPELDDESIDRDSPCCPCPSQRRKMARERALYPDAFARICGHTPAPNMTRPAQQTHR
ncbi:hypothetical protein FVE85_8726 [Porphyridium purpureum]|uniref:Uncharacterized protein n=1 Tax=Porphyridium purpureum TaxID=35688 RepID=A0A5J4YP32_PORPP|nr:hypothetical protein FVE85_8726 [Porphyridium purpureum]|eukprot:POR9238..scf296_7